MVVAAGWMLFFHNMIVQQKLTSEQIKNYDACRMVVILRGLCKML